MMKLTYSPSIDNFDEDEWTDWMLENINEVNKSDLPKEEKRILYRKILNQIVDCGWELRDWED